MTAERAKQIAREEGFELAGVTRAAPTLEALFYPEWLRRGFHGEMGYLEGRRGEMRQDARSLLPSARSVLCVGQVYNPPNEPHSIERGDRTRGWIARYAWGAGDYHRSMKGRLFRVVDRLRDETGEFEFKVAVDTSPLLERAYARQAGLGWIAKNTCLINERRGSWLFLGEILLSLDLEPDGPPPSRCGTCTRCLDACPTDALIPLAGDGPPTALDSRRCISYWTIELRGPVAVENRAALGRHVFGCDICQDVCPWNRAERAATTELSEYRPANAEPRLEELAAMSQEEFNRRFRGTPVERAKYSGFLRNVALAMGNSGITGFREPLRRLAEHPDETVREHAEWALRQLR